MPNVTLIAVSAFGLEAILKKEVLDLGFSVQSVSDGRVEFTADLTDIPKANLWLRTATRVVLKLAEFKATDFDQLFDNTKAVAWEQWLTEDAKITVTGKSVKSQLRSVRSNQSMVKKAVIERLKKTYKTQWFKETGAEFIIQIAVFKDTALLTLDTSGSGLHMRGYRAQTGEAPLKETLAAALILLSSWDQKEPLLDPMAGSGTILIEAAMMARNIAPGLNREFAAEHWPAIKPKVWREAREAARAAIRPGGTVNITGYDLDAARIKDARKNARNAGVGEDIVFTQRDVQDLVLDKPSGVLISNPPYGIKVGHDADLQPLYDHLSAALDGKTGWAFYIFTADKHFPKNFRLRRPDKIRKLYNGPIEAWFYQYFKQKNSRTRRTRPSDKTLR